MPPLTAKIKKGFTEGNPTRRAPRLGRVGGLTIVYQSFSWPSACVRVGLLKPFLRAMLALSFSPSPLLGCVCNSALAAWGGVAPEAGEVLPNAGGRAAGDEERRRRLCLEVLRASPPSEAGLGVPQSICSSSVP